MKSETKKTDPLADFKAASEELCGFEEAMRQLKEFHRRLEAMTPEERRGFRQVSVPVLGELLTPEEIGVLLASSPERGLFELERLHAVPEMVGRLGRIVTDAIRDARVAPETRARLLWRYNHLDEYRDAALSGARGVIPFGLIDSEAGRRQYCKMKRTGYETVRCSSPVFFQRIRDISSFDWKKGRIKVEEIVRQAIDADEPARLVLALNLVGRKVDARLINLLFTLRKTRTLGWLMEHDATAQEWLDPRRMLFHDCSTWMPDTLLQTIEKAEWENPGIVRSCVDALGRNLLWYTFYNRCVTSADVSSRGSALSPVEELLIRLGANPDARTAWGVSWWQMKRAKEDEDRGIALFVNGKHASDKEFVVAQSQGEGDEHRFKIVLQGTEVTMEWAFPKTLFPVVCRPYLRRSFRDKDYKGVEAVIVFRKRNGPNNEDRSVCFRRGADRLFHFAETTMHISKPWGNHA